jgi:hypothetical protein
MAATACAALNESYHLVTLDRQRRDRSKRDLLCLVAQPHEQQQQVMRLRGRGRELRTRLPHPGGAKPVRLMTFICRGEEEDHAEPRAKVMRPSIGGIGPVTDAGLKAAGWVPNFTSLEIVKLNGTDHWSLTQSKVDSVSNW